MLRHANIFKLLLPILFIGLTVHSTEDESPAYVQYANEIIRSASKQISKEFGLIYEGSGGSMPYDVEMILLDFYINQNATIEQARKFEVEATERFVKIINAHEKIRPFLREYPFPPSRTVIMIRFDPPKKTAYSPNNVKLIFQSNGKVYYGVKGTINPHAYETIKEESYEEALKIVQGK